MKKKITATAVLIMVLNSIACPATFAQENNDLTEKEIPYKKTPEQELKLRIFSPAATCLGPRPAVVFFFGGGWNGGGHRPVRTVCKIPCRQGGGGRPCRLQDKEFGGHHTFQLG